MNKQESVVFIGSYASDDYLSYLLSNNFYSQLAANQTQEYYIQGLSKYIDDIKVISALSAPSYPRCPKLIFPKNTEYYNDIVIKNVSFINLPIIRFISQSLSLIRSIKRHAKYDHNKNNIIIVYSMRLPYYLAARYLKYARPNTKFINIVPDLPQYMHIKNASIITKAKSILNQKILLILSSVFDGYVLYTKYMRDVIKCNNTNSIVLEGIISSNNNTLTKSGKTSNISKNIVLYAGGINKEYGVENLVLGFIKANIKNTELHLYGLGPYAQELIDVIDKYDNIKYFGLIHPEEIKHKNSEATLLVNPRPSKNDFTKFSCPSKTLEYMMSGVPLLMTRLQGIPKEYYDYVYTIEDESIDGISKSLIDILSIPIDERMKKANEARKFILSNKTEKVQVSKLLSFIEGL